MKTLLHNKYPKSNIIFKPKIQSTFSYQQYTLNLYSRKTQIFNNTYHLKKPNNNIKNIKRNK